MLKSKKFWVIAIASASFLCVAACAVCVVVTGIGQVGYSMLASSIRTGEGQLAPDFEASTLDGGTVKLSELRGKPVILSFGASWCPDCQLEAPILQKLAEDYSNIQIVMVDTKEDVQLVRSFVSKYGLTFTVALDQDGSIARQYLIYAIPSVYFIDQDGVIKKRFIEKIDQSQLDQALEAIGAR